MGNIVQQQVNPRLVGFQGYHRLSTHDLYKILEGECMQTLKIIRSLERDRRFDDNGRALICQVMLDLERKLHNFNEDMVWVFSVFHFIHVLHDIKYTRATTFTI